MTSRADHEVRVVAIIPARMASSRFPGKPLLSIAGLPMVEHVRRRALLCRGFRDVIVATCDVEIAQAVRAYGGRVVMTSPTHPAATDRVAEALQALDCTHVVNVQGDELLILPEDLERMVRAIKTEPEVPAWNAVARLEAAEELADRSIVKCALSQSRQLLYCAREFPTTTWRADGTSPIQKVLGILGYRSDFLRRYIQLPRTQLECLEAIDQMRIIEHDMMLRSVAFSRGYPGINEPSEVALVLAFLEQDMTQRALLEEIQRVPAELRGQV